jgi:DNA-binding transcriptional MerR regulator
MTVEPQAPAPFLQIGEAAERMGLTQRTLRFYEEKGLLKPPTRMEGGFRLYSPEDIERIEQIKQLKQLLGFSLADIKQMLEAEEVRMSVRAGWRSDADSAQKAAQLRRAREATLHQLNLIDQKAASLGEMRATLAERLTRYDTWLSQLEQAQGTAVGRRA